MTPARKRTRTSKKAGKSVSAAAAAPHELLEETARAFLVTRDAAANLREVITHSSRMAFLAVKDCERELDLLERKIDDELPRAITRVGEATARELIASLRFITDLERIGDLVFWVAQRVNVPGHPLRPGHRHQIAQMAEILQRMLDDVHQGLLERDRSRASTVIRVDAEMDELRKTIFQEQLGHANKAPQMDLLLMAQALERAGDHAINLAEELVRLVGGRSIRHTPKKQTET
jgi:phosphate transport system protein